MSSPLGKYAPMVAAFAAVFIIGSWIVAQFLNGLGYICWAARFDTHTHNSYCLAL